MKRSYCILALTAALAGLAAPQSTSSQRTLTAPPGSGPAQPKSTGTRTTGTTGSNASSVSAIPPKPKYTGPKLTFDQQELFLKTAAIKNREVLDAGTTRSERLTLSDGRVTHDGHLQCIDIFKPVFRGRSGTVEKNFRDTYKFNVAAYRLARLLNIDMVPPSVERGVEGKFCSLTWWVDDVWMTEADRRDKQIKPPAAQFWVDQLNIVRVFDQLIYNTDRNQGNLLITPEWKLWMIDHTRAFRTHPTLLKPEALGRCDFNLLAAMKKLTLPQLTRELGPYLRAEEIRGLLARRDVIVQFFETQISKKGSDAVLTGIPRSTPQVSIP